MSNRGRILIADDEQIFLLATADLLRREGYEVDTVSDGGAARQLVKQATYDLLISDLEMPGNENLSLVRDVAELAGGLPIIIVTGFPSTATAIASVELPVTAYLLKPVKFDDLLERTREAVVRFRSYQAMRRAEERLSRWRDESGSITRAQADRGDGVDAFLALTLRNVMGSLSDLELLGQALAAKRVPEASPCQVMNCPRGSQLLEAVRETVAVLEETKTAFKSKTLASLRHKLELLLQHG